MRTIILSTLVITALNLGAHNHDVLAQNNKTAVSLGSSDGVRTTLFEEADAALKIAKEAEADLLAPAAFEMGLLSYQQAESKFQRGGKLEEIRAHLQQATRHFQLALAATTWVGQAFSVALAARDDARHAEAPTLAADSWLQAEAKMKKAARTLESGNLKSAMKQAAAIEKQYRQAELEAIERHPHPNWRDLSGSIDAQRNSIAQLREEITTSQARVHSLQLQVATLEKSVKEERGTASAQSGSQSAHVAPAEIDAALQAYFSREDALVFRKGSDLIIRLFNLDFFAETAKLSGSSAEQLLRVGEILRKFPGARVTVAGHVYSARSQQANLKISRECAESVKRYLIENLHLTQAVVAVGYGDTAPLPEHELLAAPVKNERIDIIANLGPDLMSSLYRQ
ncbi:MAG: OmpA family protein [bacterium]